MKLRAVCLLFLALVIGLAQGLTQGVFASVRRPHAKKSLHRKVVHKKATHSKKSPRVKVKARSKTDRKVKAPAAPVVQAAPKPVSSPAASTEYQVVYDSMIPKDDESYVIVNPKVFYDGEWRSIAAGTAFANDWRGTSDATGVCRRFGFSRSLSFDYDGSDCRSKKEVVINRYSQVTHTRKTTCSKGSERNTWYYGNIACGGKLQSAGS